MGQALATGIVSSGQLGPGDIAIVELDAGRRSQLADLLPGVTLVDAPVESEGAVLAVKPPHVCDVAASAVAAGAQRLLSIAAGITTKAIEAAVQQGAGREVPVVRAMPNTPALVGLGATAIAAGSGATSDDLDWADALLSAVGTVARVDEDQLDAVTALSGSGPAYVFLVAEALIEAGVRRGLDPELAASLTTQTLLGSATLLAQSDDGPETLRAAVTSPGGTTAAGLAVLEDHEVRLAFVAAVEAAAARAEELGR